MIARRSVAKARSYFHRSLIDLSQLSYTKGRKDTAFAFLIFFLSPLTSMIQKLLHFLQRATLFFLWSTLSIMCLGLGLWLWGQKPLSGPPQGQKSLLINLTPGMTLKKLISELQDKQVLYQPSLAYLYIKYFEHFEQAKSGTYSLDKGKSLGYLMEKMKTGKTVRQLLLQLTIPEGWNLEQIATRMIEHRKQLSDGDTLSHQKLLSKMQQPGFLKTLGIYAPSAEGYLYPETYQFFDQKPSSSHLIKRMSQHFFSFIDDDLRTDLHRLGLSLHQGVIFASLIEKETSLEEEKNKIAEVIWNRLKKKVPLGIDAALIYGIKEYKGDIKFSHLKDRNNPYNTRIHRGLPPSPIGSVTISSLQAVVNPTQLGYLYYVLLPDSGGEHHFSDNLKEHNIFVKKLVASQSKKPLSSPSR